MTMAVEVLRMGGITKIYGNGFVANKNVTFWLNKGEILALVGENGAGKTTLMKVLFGLENPQSGQVFMDGEPVKILNPLDAISKGIGMVHQHFMLLPSLTVAENVVLGIEPMKNGFFDFKKAVEMTREVAEKYKFDIDPLMKVADLSVGQMQKVEIMKVLIKGAKIIIMDEPTAVLTPQETEELFEQLILLRENGHSIIFISHKLEEVKRICTRVTVLRHGYCLGSYDLKDMNEADISRLMVGRDVVLTVEKEKAKPTDVVLKVRNLDYTNGWNKKMLDNLSFDVRKGEILGVAGVEGNGQRELVDMLFNLNIPDGGTATVNGQNILGVSQRKIRDMGVSLIPEDRMTFGIASSGTIEENLMSDRCAKKEYNNGPLFNMKNMHRDSDALIEDYTVLCKSRNQQVGMLSGGNIQKVVVAREFSSEPGLIIADQPTRGIDVGATEFIRKKLVQLSREGAAVLLVSADLNEVMELSDSLIVMVNGKIAAYFEDTSVLDDTIMGEYMLGLKQQSDEEIRRVQHGE